jgi:hypothetical protein
MLIFWTRDRIAFRSCSFVVARRIAPDYPDLGS